MNINSQNKKTMGSVQKGKLWDVAGKDIEAKEKTLSNWALIWRPAMANMFHFESQFVLISREIFLCILILWFSAPYLLEVNLFSTVRELSMLV